MKNCQKTVALSIVAFVFLLSSFCCFAVEKDSTASTQKDTATAVKKDSEKMLLRTKRGAKLKKVRDPFDTTYLKKTSRDPFDTTFKKRSFGLSELSHLVLNFGGGWHFNDQIPNTGNNILLYNDNFCYMINLEILLGSLLKRGLAIEFS